MLLSDKDLRQRLGEDLLISPLDDPERQIQPASIDLRLSHDDMVVPVPDDGVAFDPHVEDGQVEPLASTPSDYFILPPQTLVLAATLEEVTIPPNLVGRVEGRSSIGRLGVEVHATAGFCDPGFVGDITLELFNKHQNTPVRLYAGMYICQLALTQTTSPAERPYGDRSDSKYQGQGGPTGSRLSDDFPEDV